MIPYLAGRVAAGVAVIVGLVVLSFFATHYIGDPVFLLADSEFSSEEDREALIREGGFDQPAWEQFAEFVGHAARGDFGTSIWQNRPATEVVLERVPATMLLAACTLAVIVLVAIPLAVVAARTRSRNLNTAITAITTGFGSLPSFWVALGLIFVFSVHLKWLPTGGYGSWRNLVLPVLALSIAPIGRFVQVLEASIAAELRRPYISTARAKGLSERVVLGRHAFRNVAIIGITLLGGELAILLNGAILAETIFSWPGAGSLALTAVVRRDLPVLMASVIYLGTVVTAMNLIVDVGYAFADPRVRLR